MMKYKLSVRCAPGQSKSRVRFFCTKKWLLLICLMVLLISVSGCSINYRAGRLPDVASLETSLHPGKSTQEDVAKVLGEPFGKGKEMLPIGLKPRTLWSYYYEEGSLQDARRLFLFVFLDGDKYDGYMWFSSLRK
jgi:hypothetical protein